MPSGISSAKIVQATALLPSILGRSLAVSQQYADFLQGVLAKEATNLAFYFSEEEELLDVRDGGIAVVRVSGRLMKGMFWDDYAEIQCAFDAAMDDPSVNGVLFDISSPGGSVAGCFELCEHILARRDEKKVWAYAADQATSAAYAIASSASKFNVGRGAITGSIGVIAMHVDFSEMDKAIGIKTTEIVSGKHKNDLSSNKPLNKDGRATLQKMVDLDFEVFAEHVVNGRGSLSVEDIRNMEARVFFGAEALEYGLADAQSTFDEMIENMAKGGASASTTVPAPSAGAAQLSEAPASIQGDDIMADGAVVDIEQARTEGREQGVNEGRDQERARTREITQLCQLAGLDARIAEFLASDMTVEQVRDKLITLKAEASDRPGPTDSHDPQEDKGPKASDLRPNRVYSKWGKRHAVSAGS